MLDIDDGAPPAAHPLTERWPHRHLLDVDQLSRSQLERCLDLAVDLREKRRRGAAPQVLDGEIVGLAFCEPSTRTRVSFQLAATALGAGVVDLPIEASSATKGESLADTLRTLERTGVTLIVLRHPMSGAPYHAARSTGARIVNAGDGTHGHPTQALLDALTLREALGELEGKVVALVGDIAHSRVARSNLHALATLGASVRLAGPPAWVNAFVHWPAVQVVDRLEDALAGADAVMTLRIQLERAAAGGVPTLREYAALWGITEERMRLAAPGAPLLHPGPTNEGVEVTAALAAGPRSLIGAQVRNGVPIRMAALTLLAP